MATAADVTSEIRAGAPVATLINVFTVKAENQAKLVQMLDETTIAVMRKLPGFISANIHRSTDGTRVTNYAQWESRAAFQAMLANPAAHPHMRAAEALGTPDPHLYEVMSVHHAPADEGLARGADELHMVDEPSMQR